MQSPHRTDRWTLTPNALIEETGCGRYFYGRWSRLFGCWAHGDHEPPRFTLPKWPILNARGELSLGALNKPDVSHPIYGGDSSIDEDISENASDTAPDRTGEAEAMQQWQAYVDEIPWPVRRTAGLITHYQWVALDAMSMFPKMVTFLQNSANRHFALICFAITDVCHSGRPDRSRIYDGILHESRVSFLRNFLSYEISKPQIRILMKIRESDIATWTVAALGEIISDECKRAMLAQLDEITSARIRAVWELPPELITMRLLRLVTDETPIEILGHVYRLLSLVPESVRGPITNRLRQSSQQIKASSDVDDVVQRWRECLTAEIPLPAAPIQARPPLYSLSTVDDILWEARGMHNCIGSCRYIESVILGQRYFYSWRGQERATVEIMRNRSGWTIGEVSGHNSSPVFTGFIGELKTHFVDPVT